jgi:hypothetical protein
MCYEPLFEVNYLAAVLFPELQFSGVGEDVLVGDLVVVSC